MSEPFRTGEIKAVVVSALRKFHDHRGWLAEIFRHDELEEEFHPAMAYLSWSEPGAVRGPHEHVDQADLFCFIGPSNFKLRLWDNRDQSETCHQMMTLIVGEDNPQLILIPAGVVHAYQNIGEVAGLVINCPNRLYGGPGKREKVDEIRYEDDAETIFRLDD